MAAHNELGKWGEELAAKYLQDNGYEILERDWKSGHHDLDIVAKEGHTLVIVEVKTRRDQRFGLPEEAVDYQKIRLLQQAAHLFVKSHNIDGDLRFDIIAITGSPDEVEPVIKHLKNAF
jgi:putative endonuclease